MSDKITREYVEEVRRDARKNLVRKGMETASSYRSIGLSASDKAEVLRKVADQIERSGVSDPVSRSQSRIRERDSGLPLFSKTPGKVTPELRDRWIRTRNEESQPGVKPLPGKDWTKTPDAPREFKTLPPRDKTPDRDM